MLVYYKIENAVLLIFAEDTYFHFGMRFVPSIIYSVVVMIYGMIFAVVAVKVTDWGELTHKHSLP